jgi:hypothetical protein
MAIFATQSAIRFSTTPVDIVVTRPIPNGAILIYDSKRGAFVARGNKTTPPYIEDFSVAGSGTGSSIVKEKDGSELVFKELFGGNGITLFETADSITIEKDAGGNFLTSDTDFSIVIDADNDETNAVFEVLSGVASPGSPITIPGNSFSQTGLEVIPQNDTVSSRGFYEVTGITSGFDFDANGFIPGLFITVAGTDEQDGEFAIDDVVDTGPINGNAALYVENLFTDPTDLGGFNSGVSVTAWDFRVPAPVTTLPGTYDPTKPYFLEASISDFGSTGYNLQAGMEFIIYNADNTAFHAHGPYRIAQVTDQGSGPGNYSTILVEPSTPFPDTGIITGTGVAIEVTNYTAGTGFTVDKNGNVTANNILGNNLDMQSAVLNDLTVSTNTTTNTLTVNTNAIISGNLTADTADFTSGATSGAQPVNDEDLTRKDWVEENHVRVVDPGGAHSPVYALPIGAAQLPVGPSSERPHNPQKGMIRFNDGTDGDVAVGVEVFCGYDVGGTPIWGRLPFAGELP